MNDYNEANLLKKIKNVFELVFDEKVHELGLITREDIKHLPTKEEFYSREDALMKELKDTREEQAMLSQHSRDHSDQIEKLQNIHPFNSHPAFA
ncbi:MAG: hypothetical protein Q8Q30_02470 [Candidatus Woesebacteria bacterium]|nr:hypothetical protein [Candidatus Woesebacteria bacterium]